MKLSEILSISGQSGLYRFVAQSKSGIIVENLSDGRRMPVQGTSKVSSLGDIAVFTENEDMPLSVVFQTIYDKNEGGEALSPKSSAEELKKAFKTFVPVYDEDRVHVSDMKKIFAWYNILRAAGMTVFVEESDENGQEQEDSPAEDAVKNMAAKQAVHPKIQKKETTVKPASKAKAPQQRSSAVKAK